MTVDELTNEISAELKIRLLSGSVRLVPLGNRGSSLIFRAETDDGDWFVKYPDDCSRMYPLLAIAGSEFPYFAASAFPGPIPFAGGFLTCVRFCPSTRVPPERWSDHQLESFIAAYRRFSQVLLKTTETGPMEDDAGFFAVIEDYVSRHPFAIPLLRPILEIPEAERTYPAGARLVVTHGDLHSANYGFRGDEFAQFYDLDNIIPGFLSDDLAYTVLDRAQRSSVGGRGFSRCVEILRRFVSAFGGDDSEWRIAINRKRIRQAASKLGRRPNSLIPALDVFRHDRRAVRLMRAAGLIGR